MLYIFIILAVLTVAGYKINGNPKWKKQFLNVYDKVLNYYFPMEWGNTLKEITKNNLQALMERSNLSRLIRLKAYRPLPSEGGIGIFELDTGRKGIGFELDCHTYTDEDTTKKIQNSIAEIGVKDIVVQIITYASDNVDDFVKRSEKVANYNNLNINDVKELEGIFKERLAKTEEWARSPMNRNNAVLKARNFVNMLIVLFPKEISDAKILSLANSLRGRLPLSPVPLSPKRVLEVYSEILKEGSVKGIDYDNYTCMSDQIARGADIKIEQDNDVITIGDGTYAKVLSTEKFPQYTSTINVADAFFPIDGAFQNPLPSKFLVSLTIHIEDQEGLKDKILKKAKQNIKGEGKDASLKKFSTNITDTIQESSDIISYIERDGERVYEAMWSLVVFENSVTELEQAVGRIKTSFASIEKGGWKIAEEKFGGIAFLSLLYSLPFQFDLTTRRDLQRYNVLFSSNIKSIMPLIGAFRGYPRPVIKFFGRTGQCVGIDLFGAESNFNACIIGPSGTGKSFLSNTILSSNLQAGIKTCVIDKGGSYKGICNSFQGEYVEFHEESEICLNFFTNLKTEVVSLEDYNDSKIQVGAISIPISTIDVGGYFLKPHKEEYSTIIPILKLMSIGEQSGGGDTALVEQILTSSLDIAFYRKGNNAGMADLLQAVLDQEKEYRESNRILPADLCLKLSSALEMYGRDSGRFYSFFNGTYSLDSTKDFMVIECDDLANKGDILYNIVIMSIILDKTQEMFKDKVGKVKKTIVVDEALPLLKNETTATFLDQLARRVRKHGGALIVITQNTTDFTHTSSAKGIWDNSYHKFILALNSTEIEEAFSDKGLLKSGNAFIKRQMGTVKNHKPHYSEFMYLCNNVATILLCKVSGLEYALFTSDASDKTKIAEFEKKYALSYSNARKMFGYTIEGNTEYQALKKVKEGDMSSNEIYWIGKLKTAIRENKVDFVYTKYYDRFGDVFTYYTSPIIRYETEDGSESSIIFSQIEEIASKQGLAPAIFSAYVHKIKEIGIKKFCIQIPKSLVDSGTIKRLQNSFSNDEEVIMTIDSSYIDKKGNKTSSFFEEAKSKGFKLLVNNVESKTIELGAIASLAPNFVEFNENGREKFEKDIVDQEENAIILYFKHKDTFFFRSGIAGRIMLDESVERGFSYYRGEYFEEGE